MEEVVFHRHFRVALLEDSLLRRRLDLFQRTGDTQVDVALSTHLEQSLGISFREKKETRGISALPGL